MKKLITILIVLLSVNAFGQAPNWEWAKSTGGSGIDFSQSICSDRAGNIYITGRFQSPTIIFGTDTLINSDTSGTSDIFIAKYDHNGSVMWAKKEGGSDNDLGLNITTDDSGYVYLTGRFSSPSLMFGTTLLTCNGICDMYIAKFDSTGNVLWAKSAGGTKDDESLGITCDHFGNIYATGYFWSSSITFGSITLNNFSISDTTDIFIVKYDSNGNTIWAQSAGGDSNDGGCSITTDSIGNIFLTGFFRSSFITFGSTTLSNSTNDYADILVVKFDSNGGIIWAKSVGGNDGDVAEGIAVDANGNVFVTGFFGSDSISFGGQTYYNLSSWYHDIILLKFDSNGTDLWAKTAGKGWAQDEGICVSVDDVGNVFVSGFYYSDTIRFGTTTLINNGSDDIYITKFDTNGNILWAESVGGSSWDSGAGCTTDVNGDIFITGAFMSTTIAFGTNILYDVNNFDVFVAKLGRNTGVNEFSPNSSVIIAPNPFTSQTTITFTEEQKYTTITITDILGKEIKTIHFTGKQCVIEKGEMSNGIYFVRIKDGEKNVVNRKIVIN